MSQSRPVVMKLNIPFAARQCSFFQKELQKGSDTNLTRKYALALAQEIKANAGEFQDCEIQAIRLSGGSASILRGENTYQLIRLIRESYNTVEDLPISMRVCPADINGANMPFFNRAHITRYDLELFSLEPDDFIYMDYLNYKDQLPYISDGFLRANTRPSMGFILLYGKKTISRYGFRRSVLETIRRPVSHVIFQKCGGTDLLDEAACQAQMEEAASLLREHGYHEYLPGCWAKEGCEDSFLKMAAAGTDVLAFGLGAETFFDGARSFNTEDLSLYLAHSSNYQAITAKVER